MALDITSVGQNPLDDGSMTVPDSAHIEVGEPQGMEVNDENLAEMLRPDGPLHATLLGRLKARIDLSKKHMTQRHDSWDEVDDTMKMRIDLSRNAKRPDGTSNPNKKEFPYMRGAVIPASYAIHEVRKTQLYSLFAHRSPFTQLEGTSGEDVRGAKILETMIAYDQQQSKARQFIWSIIQNADKYGIGVAYDTWKTVPGFINGPPPIGKLAMLGPELQSVAGKVFPKLLQPTRTWGIRKEFNHWGSIDVFNFWPDPRAPISAPDEWEYGGHRAFAGMMSIIARSIQNGGPYFNLEYASKYANEGPKRENYSRSRYALDNFSLGTTTDEKDKGFFALDHLQVRLVPKEWGIGPETQPDNYWFTLLDECLIIRAHKSAYDHGEFTYAVGEVNHDPHALFNAGTMENMSGLQRIINWMANSHIENAMKGMNNQLIYDPTMIEEDALLNPGPMWHIPLTQPGIQAIQAGGRSIQEFVMQVPYVDVTKGHLDTVRYLFELMQQLGASNDPAQGQALESKRTLGEIQSIMAASSARNSVTAQLLDSLVFEPLGMRAIANRQQFTSIDKFYRIVGDMAKDTLGVQNIMAGKNDIFGDYDYIPHSGVAPQDPARQAEMWTNVIGVVSQVPQLFVPSPIDGTILDIREMVNEFLRTAGIKNVDQFYEQVPTMPQYAPGQVAPMAPGAPPQVLPDEQVAQGVAAGNMV